MRPIQLLLKHLFLVTLLLEMDLEASHNLQELFLYFGITVAALAFTYSGYLVLPILIGIAGFLLYYIKNNK